MNEPAGVNSTSHRIQRTRRRVVLAVGAVVVLLAVVKVVSIGLDRFKRAGAPSTRSNIAMLESSAENLKIFGFIGCPTVQQIMDLTTPEYARTSLLMDTNGIDPWGTPYQVECEEDKVHVFSMGPDKRAGTADDIRWKR